MNKLEIGEERQDEGYRLLVQLAPDGSLARRSERFTLEGIS
jgi:hypothetical protein